MSARHLEFDRDDDAVERLDSLRQRSKLREALTRLPAAQRRAVELHLVADLPYATVAQLMHSSEAHARVRVMRGLTSLRRLLTQDDDWRD